MTHGAGGHENDFVFRSLDVPGSTSTALQGIDDAGDISGTFTDLSGRHGLRCGAVSGCRPSSTIGGGVDGNSSGGTKPPTDPIAERSIAWGYVRREERVLGMSLLATRGGKGAARACD
jgi:hypothetical protein